MKKKRKKIIITILIIIFILLLLTVGTALAFYTSVKKEEESKGLTFYLAEGNNSVSYWEYELSNDDVLAEVDHGIYYYVLLRFEYLEFRPIEGASGMVTIYFTPKSQSEIGYHSEIVEEDCFSITYYVDENQSVTEISSENKPDAVNFDNGIANLAWLKIVDSLQTFLIKIFIPY